MGNSFISVEGTLTDAPDMANVCGHKRCVFTVKLIRSNQYRTTFDGTNTSTKDTIEVVLWSKLAEICGKYLKAGSRVLVLGYLVVKSEIGLNNKHIFSVQFEGKEVNFLTKVDG